MTSDPNTVTPIVTEVHEWELVEALKQAQDFELGEGRRLQYVARAAILFAELGETK